MLRSGSARGGGRIMNNVVLIGRLTKDPEVKYIPQSETAVVNFTLAVDRPIAKEKTADFIRIVAFGKTAELCERFLTKGKQIAIQGRIQTGSYENKNGDRVYTTDVVADRVEFLGKKDEEKSQEYNQERTNIPEGFAVLEDEDCPF
jgi:single-strand DNA-binding protein